MAKGNLSLDDRELRAARAVRAVYGAETWQIVPKDIVGAPPATHDFDLFDGTTTVAVEVSTIAKTETLKNSAEWNRSFPDLAVELEDVGKGWSVMVAGTGNVRTIRRNLRTWLAELERLSVFVARTERWKEHLFSSDANRPVWFDTFKAMQAAGVIYAEVNRVLPVGQCVFIKVDGGFEYNPSDDERVSMFVSDQLEGLHASDVQKLQQATADCRVLFLWLDAESHFEIIRLLDNNVLSGSVSNAGPVDEVWIGRHFQNEAVSVYRWRAVEGWVDIHFQESDLVDTESD